MRAAVLVSFLSVVGAVRTQVEASAPWQRWFGAEAPKPGVEELPRLLEDLLPLLDSPDPTLRDDLAFTLLTKWIYRDRVVPVELRRTLLDRWLGKLGTAADAAAGAEAAVAGRSFAALGLGLLVALDNQVPWLSDAEFERVLAAGCDYLRAERDVRGFDGKLGWLHSVAHTADLLKFLARSRHLQPAGQAGILAAVADKLDRVDVPLWAGEDERLARALLPLVGRDDFAEDEFAAWVAATFAPPPATAPSTKDLAREHNRRHVLLSLHALLTVERRELAGLAAAREAVQAALAKRLR